MSLWRNTAKFVYIASLMAVTSTGKSLPASVGDVHQRNREARNREDSHVMKNSLLVGHILHTLSIKFTCLFSQTCNLLPKHLYTYDISADIRVYLLIVPKRGENFVSCLRHLNIRKEASHSMCGHFCQNHCCSLVCKNTPVKPLKGRFHGIMN